jgi:hypothetical protein
MNSYLQEHNIGYKIVGINHTYKFEFSNVNFYYNVGGVKNYHHLIMYVGKEKFQILFDLLKNKIKLSGVIETMDIYKYEDYYNNINDIINIFNIIKKNS